MYNLVIMWPMSRCSVWSNFLIKQLLLALNDVTVRSDFGEKQLEPLQTVAENIKIFVPKAHAGQVAGDLECAGEVAGDAECAGQVAGDAGKAARQAAPNAPMPFILKSTPAVSDDTESQSLPYLNADDLFIMKASSECKSKD